MSERRPGLAPVQLLVQLLALLLTLLLAPGGPAQAESPSDWPAAPQVVADGQKLIYVPVPKALKRWRLCALLPHGKDRFFWAVSAGLKAEAQRSGVDLGIYEAGGYQNLEVQRRQLAECGARGADAYLVAAIDAGSLKGELAALMRQGVPVIDLVNGLPATQATSHSRDQFHELSELSASCLLRSAAGRPVTVAWFPGPPHADWAEGFTRGMRQAFGGKPVRVIAEAAGAPDMGTQMTLVRQVLDQQPVDYVFGNAVAAEAAVRYLGTRPQLRTQVVSIYANEAVVQLIREGRVLCAAIDAPMLQARIAVDLAVRALDRKPFYKDVSPVVRLIDRDSVRNFDFDADLAPSELGFVRSDLPPW